MPKITCSINGIIKSLSISEKVYKKAEEASRQTGEHTQALLRRAAKPIIEDQGRQPTEKDFNDFLDCIMRQPRRQPA